MTPIETQEPTVTDKPAQEPGARLREETDLLRVADGRVERC